MAGTSLDERVTRLETGANGSPIEVCHTSGVEAIGVFVLMAANAARRLKANDPELKQVGWLAW